MSTLAQVFGQAWKLHQAGNLSQAEQLYRQVVQADPQHADAWCFLGAVSQAQGKIADAESQLRRAVQLLPNHPSAPNLLGIILAQQGKHEEAARCFQDLLRYQPADAGLLNNLGLVRLQQGRPEEALASFHNALRFQPNHADAYGNIGTALLQLGRVDEAIANFERALQLKPDLWAIRDSLNRARQQRGQIPVVSSGVASAQPSADARRYYQTAMSCVERGQLAQSEPYFQQAITLQPDYFDAIHNLATVLFMQEKHEAAINQYRQALRINPRHPGGLYNLGVALQHVDQIEEALSCYRQALALQPSHLDARNNLGNLLKDKGRHDEAIACYQEVLRLKPDYAEVQANVGIVHAAKKEWDTAVFYYRRALSLKPTYPDAHNSLGIALMELGRLEEAEASSREALRLKPSFAEAHNSLGTILEKQSRLDAAVASFHEAIRLKPNMAQGYNNLGNALKRQSKYDEAVDCYKKALQLKPDYAEAHTNLGNIRVQQTLYDEAQLCYNEALRLEPEHPETHFNQSLLWLQLGKWEQGWREYEWRWTTKSFPRYSFTQPRWDGSRSSGQTVLLLAEQGLGDTLQFIRYAPALRERCDRVILQCQTPLLRLLSDTQGVDQVVPQSAPLPAFDAYIPLLSLPGILGASVDDLLSEVPYLHPDSALVDQWKTEMSEVCNSHYLIGIAWQGNPIFRVDRQRSVPLEQFSRLAEIPGVRLISLQKGPGTEQLPRKCGVQSAECDVQENPGSALRTLYSALRTPVLDEASGPFMDTAALMKSLDLVISSDTAVPHLAGALGVPVWVALPLVPDWRWLLDREDCPWYPSMRLFRQTKFEQWNDVFERMAEELRHMLAA
jgi:tetratricopeptide (TPR) repeat protein